MRRLLIYLTYDKKNIVDDYIGYFLKCMREITDSIVVICNMPRIEKGFHNLSDYADGIFYRDNIGLDAGGFKDAFCTFIGWNRIRQYDEVILSNDSFYGPFEDIGSIFSEMESRCLDFWGLMKRGPGRYGSTGSDPEHLLSFFYVFQAPLLHSGVFRDYWEEMPYYRDYMTVVKQYERKLTSYFSGFGYIYDAYADTAANETENLKNQFFQCDYLSYEMLTKRNFPFLKRKQLAYNTLYMQTQENLALSIDYVDKYTDYDVNLILMNLIRTQNVSELQRSLGLQYIVNTDGKRKHPDVATCGQAGSGTANAVLFIWAEWMNATGVVMEYLEKICRICDIRIFTDKKEIEAYYQGKGLSVSLWERTDVEALLEADTEKYSYICFLHDVDLSSDQLPSCSGKSYFFNIWENLVKDEEYIYSLLEIFEKNQYIGMLMHPVPIFGTWIGKIGEGWADKFDKVEYWIRRLELDAVIDTDIPPIHITGNFWIKADVLDSLKKKIKDCPEAGGIPKDLFSYLWTYIVQDSGKLTGIVESDFYASLNETNYHYYLKTFLEWFSGRYGIHGKLQEYKEIFHIQWAVEQCRNRYKEWYVYGTGEIAERCFRWVRDTKGFIVSDGHKRAETFHGKPIICLSELRGESDFGIILCLSKENQRPVVCLLNEKGIKNYYVIN